MKTGSFVVISCSKLDPYRGVHTCNKQLTQWVFFIIHCKLQNICHVNFVVAGLLWQNLHNLCFVFHDDYWLRPIVQALSLSLYIYIYVIPVSFTSSNIIHWHSTKCTDKYMWICQSAAHLKFIWSTHILTHARTLTLSLSLSKDIHFLLILSVCRLTMYINTWTLTRL